MSGQREGGSEKWVKVGTLVLGAGLVAVVWGATELVGRTRAVCTRHSRRRGLLVLAFVSSLALMFGSIIAMTGHAGVGLGLSGIAIAVWAVGTLVLGVVYDASDRRAGEALDAESLTDVLTDRLWWCGEDDHDHGHAQR